MPEKPLRADDVRSWPKVDLHRHLEGSVRPATTLELFRKNYGRYWDRELDEFRSIAQVTGREESLIDFLRIFERFMPAIVTEEDLRRVTQEAIEDAAVDGIVYLELRHSPHYISQLTGLDVERATLAVLEGKELAEERYPIQVELILIMLQSGGEEEGAHTVDLAVRYRDRGVRGVDIAGDVRQYGLGVYRRPMERASSHGLGITVHAGEMSPADTVAAAVRDLHATRIGHGIRAIDDEAVLDLLRDRGVVLEVCVTSNVQTRAVSSLGEHPICRLIDAGVAVTINSDDPCISAITLSDEYVLLAREWGVDRAFFERQNLRAIDAAFTTSAKRSAVRALLQSHEHEEKSPQSTTP